MSWEQALDRDRLSEWTRSDGNATIRLRERPDGRYTIRLDRLQQAPEGPAYRRETVDDRAAATELLKDWKVAFDASEQ